LPNYPGYSKLYKHLFSTNPNKFILRRLDSSFSLYTF